METSQKTINMVLGLLVMVMIGFLISQFMIRGDINRIEISYLLLAERIEKLESDHEHIMKD